jgi:hypothetical protein
MTVTADDGTNEVDNTESKVAFTPLVAAQFSMFEVLLRYALIDSFISIRAGINF